MFVKWLFKLSLFLPLNPYLSIESNICEEEEKKAFYLKIQSESILPVFKKDQSRQCEEESGLPPKIMKEILEKAKVKVFKTAKGKLLTGRNISLCGSDTGNINIFYILKKDFQTALGKGFSSCIPELNSQ